MAQALTSPVQRRRPEASYHSGSTFLLGGVLVLTASAVILSALTRKFSTNSRDFLNSAMSP